MTATVCTLVIASATTHAYWNLLLKRAGGEFAVVAISKAIEAALLLPVLVFARGEWPAIRSSWFYPLAGAMLVGANYGSTSAAYRRAELSLVYPTARGGVLLFLPPLSFLMLGERIDWFGAAALMVVAGAIALLPLQHFTRQSVTRLASSWNRPEMRFAWAAGVSGAGYTVCGAYAVRVLSPLTYFACYSVIVGGAFAASLAVSDRRTTVAAWQRHWPVATRIALLNTVSYVLMLYALRSGHTSYATGVRQLGIAIGVLLGWQLLGEHISRPRRVAIALLIAGCVGVAFAR